jgi:hypothetical protein
METPDLDSHITLNLSLHIKSENNEKRDGGKEVAFI